MRILMAARHPVGGIRTFMRYVYSQPCFEDCSIRLLAVSADLGEYLGSYVPPGRISVEYVGSDLRAMSRAIRRELSAGRYDMLHSHGLTTGVAAELGRIGSGVPHLLTAHDVFLPSTFRGVKGRFQQLGLNLLLRRCDAIHAVSNDCAANFSEYLPLVPRKKVHAIVNGIDTAQFANAEPVNARRELGLPEDAFLIGFFGRFMAQKGFRTLVDAVEILVGREQERPLRVLTFGGDGFIREDYEYLRGKGLGGNFVQCPETTEPERWMKAVDVVAMPSRWEACPLQPMEALAAGVPMIGTDCIGLREVIAGTPSLVAEIGDPVSLADRLTQALNPVMKAECVRFSSEACRRFDVSETAIRIRHLYGEISRPAQLRARG